MTASDVLSHAGLSQEELEHALGCLATKVTIVLKRELKECWTNQYNEQYSALGMLTLMFSLWWK